MTLLIAEPVTGHWTAINLITGHAGQNQRFNIMTITNTDYTSCEPSATEVSVSAIF